MIIIIYEKISHSLASVLREANCKGFIIYETNRTHRQLPQVRFLAFPIQLINLLWIWGMATKFRHRLICALCVDWKTAPSFARSPKSRVFAGRATPSSSRSPISRTRSKTCSKTPLFGLLAKEGAVLQSTLRGAVSGQTGRAVTSRQSKPDVHSFVFRGKRVFSQIYPWCSASRQNLVTDTLWIYRAWNWALACYKQFIFTLFWQNPIEESRSPHGRPGSRVNLRCR